MPGNLGADVYGRAGKAQPKGPKRRWALAGVAAALGGCLATAAPATAASTAIDVKGELECLALTIYFEARGEPDEGKIAVGHVVMNRAQHPLFPGGVCKVVRQGGEKLRSHCQFSWWCDGRSDRPRDRQAWTKSRALAGLVYWDYSRDPTAGALWYHADYASPSWRHGLTPGPKIGRHVFYGLTQDRALTQDRELTRDRDLTQDWGLTQGWLQKPFPGGSTVSYTPD